MLPHPDTLDDICRARQRAIFAEAARERLAIAARGHGAASGAGLAEAIAWALATAMSAARTQPTLAPPPAEAPAAAGGR